MRDALPPDDDTDLLHWPWVELRLRCHYCARHADVRLAALAAKFGHRITVRSLVTRWIDQCAWSPRNPTRKPQKYGMKCGGYCPDVLRRGPPDRPPSMAGLVLVEGGKADLLPAEPKREDRRRRVGSDD